MQVLPWVLHRVHGLLHALSLAGSHWQERQALLEEERGEPDLPPEQLMLRLLGVEAGLAGPSPGHLVHSLTLPAAGDRSASVVEDGQPGKYPLI